MVTFKRILADDELGDLKKLLGAFCNSTVENFECNLLKTEHFKLESKNFLFCCGLLVSVETLKISF